MIKPSWELTPEDLSSIEKLYQENISSIVNAFAKELSFNNQRRPDEPYFTLVRYVPPDYTGLKHAIQINLYGDGQIKVYINVRAGFRNPRFKESMLIHVRTVYIFSGELPRDIGRIKAVLQKAKSVCEGIEEKDLQPFGENEIPEAPIMNDDS